MAPCQQRGCLSLSGGRTVVRRAAWVLLAPTAALAALSPPAVAQGGQADDPVRRQAEELAEEASKKFGEVLKGEKAEPAEPGPRRREAMSPAPERSLGLLFYWLDYSEQQYRGIMQRLAAEGAGWGWDPATVGWLRRSNQEFQGIIEKLARAGGSGRPWDPVAEAAQRQNEAQSELPPPAPPPAAAATPSGEMAAGGGGSPEPRPGGEAAPVADAGTPAQPSPAPVAEPPADAAARPAVEGKQAQGSAAAPPAAAKPDITEPPAPPERKLEIARGEEAATARGRPPEGEEEAPARPRQAPAAALDAGEAPEEAAAARKREDAAPPAPAPAPPVPPPSEPRGGQEAKIPDAHADKQAAAAPSPAILPQRLQSGVAQAASGAAGSGSDRCQLAGVEAEVPGWYVVKKGDTLWAIAKRHYGAGARYRGIFEANRGQLKKGPDWILPCQRLYLPQLPRQPRRGAPPERP